jgi:uncharacterized protein
METLFMTSEKLRRFRETARPSRRLALKCGVSAAAVNIKKHIRMGLTFAFTAMLLGGALQARAQAPSNPAINAQLLVGARQNDITQVERMLSQGAAPNSRNRLGKTALLIATEKGQLAMATRLIAAGSDVNLASLERVTPLMAACYTGHVALVKLLLDAGARTDGIDQMNKPAVVYAAAQGHASALEALLNATGSGAVNVNTAYEHGLTALMWAAGQGHVDAVKLLLARGAQAAARDDRGMTALDIAKSGAFSAAQAEVVASLSPSP